MSTTAAATARPDTRDMVVAHGVFRRLFGDLPALVRGVAVGDTARATVLADTIVEVATALHHHHSVEDELLWPVLLERAGTDRADKALVLRAEEQHERIHELLDRTDIQVEAFRADARAADRDALAATVAELHRGLCDHLDDEEAHILPLVEQHVTAAEWDAIGERARANIPRDRLLIQLGWLLQGLDAAEQRDLLRHLPLIARMLWRVLGRRRFAAERRRVYGT